MENSEGEEVEEEMYSEEEDELDLESIIKELEEELDDDSHEEVKEHQEELDVTKRRS